MNVCIEFFFFFHGQMTSEQLPARGSPHYKKVSFSLLRKTQMKWAP